MSQVATPYPPGSVLRVKQIVGTKDKPGLLPIHVSTWYEWIAEGKVPPGRKLGGRTTVWPLEVVLAVGRGEPMPAPPATA